jgi:phosphatidylglycerol lysyltransferase
MSRIRSRVKRLTPLIGLVSFGVAVAVLAHELRETRLEDLVREFRAIPRHRILLSIGLTALDYLPLFGLDFLALRTIGRRLPYKNLALVSFVGFSFSRAVGFAMLSGGAVRYRLCSLWGLSPFDIAKLIAFASMISWLGFLAVGGVVFTLTPPPIPAVLSLPWSSTRGLGALFLLILVAFLIWCARRVTALRIGSWSFSLPSLERALAMVVVASANWVLAAGIIFVLFTEPSVSFTHFIGIFLLAQFSGVASQVPGGLGVLETVMILFLDPAEPARVLGPLLIYRLIYYFIPLGLAAVLLAGFEIRAGRLTARETASGGSRG